MKKSESPETIFIGRRQVLESALGDHYGSPDWEFQEAIRQMTATLSKDPHDSFYYNGWATAAAIRLLLQEHPKISNKLRTIAGQVSFECGTYDTSRNIRARVKEFLMFPLNDYPEWTPIAWTPFKFTIDDLNNAVKGKEWSLQIKAGKLCCYPPPIPITFKTPEPPYIVVINSDKLKPEHKKYEQQKISDIIFLPGFFGTYCLDTPLLEEVIVAQAQSNALSGIMEEIGIKKNIHMTVYASARTGLSKLNGA